MLRDLAQTVRAPGGSPGGRWFKSISHNQED